MKTLKQRVLDDEKRQVFTQWFKTNLIVDRFPVAKELRPGGNYGDCKVIINVSDEYYLGNSEEIMKNDKLNYYFPMGESTEQANGYIGLTSLYGALHVLHQVYTYNPEWKILIHCQAGRNRSVVVAAAFYYMMYGEHMDFDCNAAKTGNRLLYNCEKKYLPSLSITELFLQKCFYAFENPECFLGGVYDWVITESFEK